MSSGTRILTRKGKEVPTVSLHQAIAGFLDWLENLRRAEQYILLSHNCKAFDMTYIITAVLSTDLSDRFSE